MKTTPPVRGDIEAVLRFLPVTDRPDFKPGRWAGGDPLPDGSIPAGIDEVRLVAFDPEVTRAYRDLGIAEDS